MMWCVKEEGIDVYVVYRENYSNLEGKGKGCVMQRVRVGQVLDGKIRSQIRLFCCIGVVIIGY